MTRLPTPPGLLWSDAPGKARHDHPSTSHAAARSAAPGSGSARMRVLRAIVAAADGMTDHEIQAALAMNASTQRPRRVELAEHGLIVARGTRATPSGRQAQVWYATEAGREAL